MAEAAASKSSPSGQATIRYGSFSVPMNVVGRTVEDVKKQLAPEWGMPGDVSAKIGKSTIEGNHVIVDGETITFFKVTGDKG